MARPLNEPESIAVATVATQTLPQLVRASDTNSRAVDWIWDDWLACGKLHLIAGAPSLAKTTIALKFAATVTTGGTWPDGKKGTEAGDVVIWSGEDGIDDTLIPRLKAMGADLSRVHFVKGIPDVNGGQMPFDPAKDMPALSNAVTELSNLKLLIIDPVVSAVPGDSSNSSKVRRGLQPLVDFAEKFKAAVIGITHFSRGTSGREPLDRVNGSIAFGALARLVFGVAKLKDKDDKEFRVFVRIKNNIGPDGGGFRYTVEHVDIGGGVIGSKVVWGDPIEGTAMDIFQNDSVAGEVGVVNAPGNAYQLLQLLLKDGPIDAKEAILKAEGHGFSKRAMQRAAQRLGVVRQKDGMHGPWRWHLPLAASNSPDDNQGATS